MMSEIPKMRSEVLSVQRNVCGTALQAFAIASFYLNAGHLDQAAPHRVVTRKRVNGDGLSLFRQALEAVESPAASLLNFRLQGRSGPRMSGNPRNRGLCSASANFQRGNEDAMPLRRSLRGGSVSPAARTVQGG